MTRTRILLVAVGILGLVGVTLGGVALWVSSNSPPYVVARALTPEEAEAGVPLESQSFDTFEAAMASIGADPDDFRPAEPPVDSKPADDHCVVSISSVQPGELYSVVSEPQCYSTFSEAWAAANGAGPEGSRTVIGIDYWDAEFQGASLTWSANNTVGCNTGLSYSAASMPSGWNDTVSSAKTYGGCSTNTHYEATSSRGTQLVCQCATMGVMNNQTSSERWGP